MSNTRTINVEMSTSTAHRLKHYPGICSNVHGHNLQWDVEIVVGMGSTGKENMPLDFKEVSDVVDRVDHAILLNGNDPMVDVLSTFTDEPHSVAEEMLGDVIWFDGDPTCEQVVEWMASRLLDLDSVLEVTISLAETGKYDIGGVFYLDDGEVRTVRQQSDTETSQIDA